MRGKKAALLALLICFLSSVVATPSPVSGIAASCRPSYGVAEADVESMFPDVDLISEPNYRISGNSGEFSYFHSTYYDNDSGVSMMTWNHTANTSITLDDGVCFEKSFDWPHAEYPRSMYVSVEFAFDLSGDFVYSPAMSRYGCLRAYLVTPLGEIIRIGFSDVPNGYYYQQLTMDCSPVIGDAWYELLNDMSPERNTTFSIRIGLFPDWDFVYGNAGSEPWRVYTGSMLLLVRSLSLVLARGTPKDSGEVASPIWENHWEPPHTYSCKGLAILDDGTLVSLIHSYSDDDESGFDDMVLLRWDSTTSLLSEHRVPDCEPEVITSDGEHIYVTGGKNGVSFLSKWSGSGFLVWNRTWDLGLDYPGDCLTVDSEGAIYFSLRCWNITSSDIDSYLVKVDKDGNEVWQKSLNQTWISEIHAGNGTSFYTLESGRLLKEWDASGNVLSTQHGMDDFRIDSGNLITLRNDFSMVTLNRTEPGGTTLWSTSISIEYYPDFIERVSVRDVEIAPDGSILLLLFLDRYAEEYRLYRYYANGTLDGYKVVGWMPLRGVWESYDMVASSNGLVYLSASECQTYGNYLGESHPKIEAYNYTDYIPFLVPHWITPVIFVGAGITLLSVVTIVVRRRRTPT